MLRNPTLMILLSMSCLLLPALCIFVLSGKLTLWLHSRWRSSTVKRSWRLLWAFGDPRRLSSAFSDLYSLNDSCRLLFVSMWIPCSLGDFHRHGRFRQLSLIFTGFGQCSSSLVDFRRFLPALVSWKHNLLKFFFRFLSLRWSWAGFSFESGGRTFHPVVFYFMSSTLISIFEEFFILLLLQFVFT